MLIKQPGQPGSRGCFLFLFNHHSFQIGRFLERRMLGKNGNGTPGQVLYFSPSVGFTPCPRNPCHLSPSRFTSLRKPTAKSALGFSSFLVGGLERGVFVFVFFQGVPGVDSH